MTAPRSPYAPVAGATRWLLLGLSILCLALGVVGLFLPVLPTVPFLIVAAWAAARSSPRLHHWLYTHPRFGRQLRDWEERGAVPRRAKWFATVMMSISGVFLLVLAPQRWMALVAIAGMVCVAVWLWRRPEVK